MTNIRIGARGRTLRVAIVGCGGIANQHVRAYAGSGRTVLVRLGDVVPERVEARAGCPVGDRGGRPNRWLPFTDRDDLKEAVVDYIERRRSALPRSTRDLI